MARKWETDVLTVKTDEARVTDVVVPAEWVAAGSLPPVCAWHGIAATRSRDVRFSGASGGRRDTARLPGCDRCVRDQRVERGVALAVLVVVAAFVRFALGALVQDDPARLLSYLVMALPCLAGFRTQPYLWKRVTGTVGSGGWVLLRGVHPGFAAAALEAKQALTRIDRPPVEPEARSGPARRTPA
jgi:hypothetical protein